MTNRYDEAWAVLPEDPEPWEWERRSAILLDALRPGDRWMDLGCGAGRFLTLAPNGIGVDVAPRALERAARIAPDAELVLSEGESLPIERGSVDLVWCSEVIGLVVEPSIVLAQAHDALRDRGRLVLTTPGYPWWRRMNPSTFDPLGQHLRFFTRRSLSMYLDMEGFAARVRGQSWLVAHGWC